ncbi:MAG: hypothetical protein Q7S53_00595 [bacterium]|nr:hypothetical protein [bacterium]
MEASQAMEMNKPEDISLEGMLIRWLSHLRHDEWSKVPYYLAMAGIGAVWSMFVGIMIVLSWVWLPGEMASTTTLLMVMLGVAVLTHLLFSLGRDVKRYKKDEEGAVGEYDNLEHLFADDKEDKSPLW